LFVHVFDEVGVGGHSKLIFKDYIESSS
jgi:hypothetical protein